MDSNEEIFKKILDDDDFRNLLFEFYLSRLFKEFRTGTTESEPVHGDGG